MTQSPFFLTDLYTFAVAESAAVGTTVGRIMADDGDIGVNARMNYSLEDLEESSTFKIQTDPVTQEGIILLAKVRFRNATLEPFHLTEMDLEC